MARIKKSEEAKPEMTDEGYPYIRLGQTVRITDPVATVKCMRSVSGTCHTKNGKTCIFVNGQGQCLNHVNRMGWCIPDGRPDRKSVCFVEVKSKGAKS